MKLRFAFDSRDLVIARGVNLLPLLFKLSHARNAPQEREGHDETRRDRSETAPIGDVSNRFARSTRMNEWGE